MTRTFPSIAAAAATPHLVDWLKGVQELAHPKPPTGTSRFRRQVTRSCREKRLGNLGRNPDLSLTPAALSSNFIISVGTKNDLAVFDDVLVLLKEREGGGVDSEDDAGAVVKPLFSPGDILGNIGYGDGIRAVSGLAPARGDGWSRLATSDRRISQIGDVCLRDKSPLHPM